MKSISRWAFEGGWGNIRRAQVFSVVCHVIAVACALYGLYLIVADSLDSAVYGVVLFGLAIALDVVVASRSDDRAPRRRPVTHPRIINIRSKKPRRAKRAA
jgi:hypothetical protein